MKSIIRSLRPRVAKTVVNKNYTAVGFMRMLLTTVLSYLATHGSSPSIFGTDYNSGHAMISSVDLPYAALDIASTVAHAPDLEALCGSTGIINVGVCSKYIVFKYKWLVSAPASRSRQSSQSRECRECRTRAPRPRISSHCPLLCF